MSILEWVRGLWQWMLSVFGKGIAEFVALILFALIALITKKTFRSIQRLVDYHRRIGRALTSIARRPTPAGPVEGEGIWLTKPIVGALADNYLARLEASRVLVVANAKGGVGKTTTAANLGARFAEILTKPVLLIDLDFQGTLSSMALAKQGSWVPPQGSDSQASRLISGDLRPADIASTGLAAAGQPKLKVITAFYDLAQAENRVMIEWLLGDRQTDIRFRLASLLHDPAVREAFSLIIIDSPPRLTTGAIQALAAGTHILIPTIMDEPSTEAVVTFIRQVENFRSADLCPRIKYIGVTGSLSSATDDTTAAQKSLADRLADAKENGGAGSTVKILPIETFLNRSKFFRKAVSAGGIAYLTMGDSADAKNPKQSIIALAEYVKQEMRL